MPLPCAAHGLGENVHLFRDQGPILLAYRRGANELIFADVGDACLLDADDHEVVGQLDVHALPVARLDGQHIAVELLDGTANSHRRSSRAPCSRAWWNMSNHS